MVLQTNKVDMQCPYQQPVFLSVFLAFHFTYASDLIQANPDEFQLLADSTTGEEEMPDAMIAAASTGASLYAS